MVVSYAAGRRMLDAALCSLPSVAREALALTPAASGQRGQPEARERARKERPSSMDARLLPVTAGSRPARAGREGIACIHSSSERRGCRDTSRQEGAEGRSGGGSGTGGGGDSKAARSWQLQETAGRGGTERVATPIASNQQQWPADVLASSRKRVGGSLFCGVPLCPVALLSLSLCCPLLPVLCCPAG